MKNLLAGLTASTLIALPGCQTPDFSQRISENIYSQKLIVNTPHTIQKTQGSAAEDFANIPLKQTTSQSMHVTFSDSFYKETLYSRLVSLSEIVYNHGVTRDDLVGFFRPLVFSNSQEEGQMAIGKLMWDIFSYEKKYQASKSFHDPFTRQTYDCDITAIIMQSAFELRGLDIALAYTPAYSRAVIEEEEETQTNHCMLFDYEIGLIESQGFTTKDIHSYLDHINCMRVSHGMEILPEPNGTLPNSDSLVLVDSAIPRNRGLPMFIFEPAAAYNSAFRKFYADNPEKQAALFAHANATMEKWIMVEPENQLLRNVQKDIIAYHSKRQKQRNLLDFTKLDNLILPDDLVDTRTDQHFPLRLYQQGNASYWKLFADRKTSLFGTSPSPQLLLGMFQADENTLPRFYTLPPYSP